MTNLEQNDGLSQIWVALQRILQNLLLDVRQHVLHLSTSSWCPTYVSTLAAWASPLMQLSTST